MSQLGILGPLRAARGPHQAPGPVVSRIPPEHTRAARRTRQLLALGTLGGALTGGAALAIVSGILAAAAADLLEASGISPGATLFVSIARGFIMGAIQGAVVGALTTYYGGGMWTGAKVGAALAVGISLMQALVSGALALVTLPMIVAALLLIGCAGGAVGALVGAAVGALAPSD